MAASSTEYKRGTRIVVTDDLPGVPEGTPGKVGRAVGLTLTRYRVRFDNEVEFTSVAADKLVRADEWNDFRERREAERAAAAEQAARQAAAAAEASAAPTAPAADAPAEDSPAADPRLAALMAKSKAAKAAKGVVDDSPAEAPAPAPAPAAAPTPAEPAAAEPASAGGGDVDPRLAALTARSRAARKEAGVDVDAEPADARSREGPSSPPAKPAPPGAPRAAPAPADDLPQGYFPVDNRVAELLARIESGDVTAG